MAPPRSTNVRRPEPGDDFIYDRYARQRVCQRNISKEDVDDVVKNPLTIEPSRHDPTRSVLTRTVGRRTISVVVAPEGAHWVVVTAWELE